MRLLLNRHGVLMGVLCLAGMLRLGWLMVDFDQLRVDRDGYLGLAESLADGRGLSLPGTTEPTAFRPPLYPMVLAAVLPGTRPFGPVAVQAGIAVLHLVLGVGTVWLTWRLARCRLPERAALVAALLVAVDPLLVQYTARPMTETLCAFLAVLLLVQLEHVRQARTGGDETGPGAWYRRPIIKCGLAGVVFGLCVLCRPTFWIPGGIYAGLVLCRAGWLLFSSRSKECLGRVKQLAAVAAGAGCLVLPWVFRNWLMLGVPVLATTHGGYTLLLANNPVFYQEVVAAPVGTVWQGDSLSVWQEQLEHKMRQAGIDINDEPARDRWMRNRAFRHMAAAPGFVVRAGWLKLRRFFSIRPLAGSAEGLRKYAVLAAALIFLTGYLLIGVSCVRHRGNLFRQFWPALVLLAGFCLVHAVFWTNARMRAPVVPVLALLASAALISPRSLKPEQAAPRPSRE